MIRRVWVTDQTVEGLTDAERSAAADAGTAMILHGIPPNLTDQIPPGHLGAIDVIDPDPIPPGEYVDILPPE